MGLNKILLELRTEQGMSQKELARAIDVSQSTIAKIEVNRNEATASTIRKLSKFFNVSADYLLGLKDEFGGTTPASENKFTTEEQKIICQYRQLSPEYKTALKAVLQTLSDASRRNN